MANDRSATKAHAQSLKRRERNSRLKSRMRRAIRAARLAIEAARGADDEAASAARSSIRVTTSLIDTLAGKGVIHRNAAARHKARLHRRLQHASAAD